MENKDIISFLEDLKEFRVNEELPFGTIDYHNIDDMIKFMKDKE